MKLNFMANCKQIQELLEVTGDSVGASNVVSEMEKIERETSEITDRYDTYFAVSS